MERDDIKLYARAYQDLDEIYAYIAGHLLNPSAATQLIDALEAAICSLEQQPERGALRRTGAYVNRGYRQLFVKNYVIIYRVLKELKQVHIVTICYMSRMI